MNKAQSEFIRIFGEYEFTEDAAWHIFLQGWTSALIDCANEVAKMKNGGDTTASMAVYIKNMAHRVNTDSLNQ
jgi:hypothetical protein